MKYECIIVGGGPAGLSAAIHLAWHGRRVLVIDRRSGPLNFTLEKLYNVPGLPATSGPGILKALRDQVESLGGEILRADVRKAEGENGDFLLTGAEGETWCSDTLLLATGVARNHPTVDGDFTPCFKYAGKGNMYYCPDCEAPEIRGKDTLVIAAGSADGGAGMAVGLSRYASCLRVLGTRGDELGEDRRELLAAKGIEFLSGEIVELKGEKRELRSVVLKGGVEIAAEAFFVSSPAKGRTELAEQLGVTLAATGHHAQPASQRGDTNVPGVWIAGDLRPMSQQVAVAMGTGNVAALMIDQTLRRAEVLP
jgi:thioredoxin reductase (NADPH)